MAPNNPVQAKRGIAWSDISQTIVNVERLGLLTHTPKQLTTGGYITKPLTERELWAKMRCQNCGGKLKKYQPTTAATRRDVPQIPLRNSPIDYDYDEAGVMVDNTQYLTQLSQEQQYTREVERARAAGYYSQPTKHTCFFHDGQLFKGEYKCCGGRQNTQGCRSEVDHLPSTIEELQHEWWIHATPEHNPQFVEGASLQSSLEASRSLVPAVGVQNGGQSPAFRSNTVKSLRITVEPRRRDRTKYSVPKRAAVALDCEMGTTTLFASTLIRLTAIDFFTREVLIDSLVAPAPPHYILHYNTRYSGVTFAAMRNAIRGGNVIHGADAARKLLFQHIDGETIIIVHGGENDFKTLRWLHPTDKIVDTCILESYDPEVKEKGWRKNLKDVTFRRCNGIEIQNAKLTNGRDAGHDSLEDALACREIVVAWMRMIPDV